jgi:hypothetical protein
MVIHVMFDVHGLMGGQVYVTAYFNYWQDGPLSAFDSPAAYRDEDGHVRVGSLFVPDLEDTHFPDVQLFMPYEKLRMAPGASANLMCQVILWDKRSPVPQELARSGWYQFTYTS